MFIYVNIYDTCFTGCYNEMKFCFFCFFCFFKKIILILHNYLIKINY